MYLFLCSRASVSVRKPFFSRQNKVEAVVERVERRPVVEVVKRSDQFDKVVCQVEDLSAWRWKPLCTCRAWQVLRA